MIRLPRASETRVVAMSLADVLDACTDDVLLAIAVSLPTATDLLRLILTNHATAQRFCFSMGNNEF